MATLSLRLTTNGGKFKGRLVVECATRENGKTLKRHYKVVQGLQSPSYSPECWNEKEGLFISGPNAVQNNHVTKLLLDELQEFIDTGSYSDGRQLYDAYDYSKAHPEAAPSATFGEFLESIMEKLKAERRSSNIEQYTTLYHALTGVNKKVVNRPKHFTPPYYNGMRLFDIPIRAISNRHFIAFGDWIKDVKKGAGYRNLMTTFKAVVSKAHQQELTSNTLTYKFKTNMPIKALSGHTAKEKIRAKGESITILTEAEFAAFERFDILKIAPPQQRFQELLQIYKDLVLLLYYTRSRPADVISLRHGKEYDEESHTIIYTPRKLASRINAKERPCCVTLQLPKQAIAIINKYKGRSKGGYLLPLPMNEREWDIPTEFPTWYVRVKNVEQRINQYLKKIAVALNLEVKDLSLYDFRHSAITHAVRAGENVFMVAQQAGTSVNNIERYYYNSIR